MQHGYEGVCLLELCAFSLRVVSLVCISRHNAQYFSIVILFLESL